MLAREQPTGPAECARDFIGDEQRAARAAEVASPDGVFSNQDARLMLIGSMTNAAMSRRFSRCSMRRSAFASSGTAILPQCGSRFFICSRLSDAPMLNRQACCRGNCLRATAMRGGRYGSSPPAARGRPPRIHRSRGSRS